MTFQIVYVCVANICRSPLAERLTRHELGGRAGASAFTVASAGTRGHTGEPMHRHGAAVLRSVGADPDGFVARRLSPDILRDADLVLTATATERDKAVALLPAALRTTFTLLEFARLLDGLPAGAIGATGDPAERAVAVVAGARGMRGRVPYRDPSFDEIADPVRTPEGFRDCLASVAPAVRTVVGALCSEPALPRALTRQWSPC
jgi:protein-tyrosine phosphatase